ncbi:hypothetical protein F4810DRAFT_716806 [Camillea tinctor]|nr:hypothetical protein F4810DRAFT_716806 [Camillea tinctor]
MSLYRWSLPTRVFNRERSSDNDSNQSTKFSTVHIGQPGTRRRANLSAVFATLFDKSETCQDNPVLGDQRSSGNQTLPLVSRTENIPHPPDFKPRHTREPQDTAPSEIDTERSNNFGKSSVAKWNSIAQPLRNSLRPRSDTLGQGPAQQLGTSVNFISNKLHNEGDTTENGKEKPSLELVNLSDCLDRVRSTSSSYPTEGIRSPPDYCRSPEPATGVNTLISEYSRIGDYPSQILWNRSSELTSDNSCPDPALGQSLIEELAAAESVSDTESRTTNQDKVNQFSLPIVSPQSVVLREEASSPQPCLNSDVLKGSDKENQKYSSSSDCMVPVLKNMDSCGSALDVSFMSYKVSIAGRTSDDDTSSNISRTNSTDRLRPSIETSSTACTTLRGQQESSGLNSTLNPTPQNLPKSTTPRSETLVGDSEQPTWCLPEPNHSAGSLVKRIQKFKFKKWVRKVCLRTRVRFEHVVKPDNSALLVAVNKRKSSKARHSKKTGAKGKKISTTMVWRDYTRSAKKKQRQLKRAKQKQARKFLKSFTEKESSGSSEIWDGGPQHHDICHERVGSCPAYARL